MKQAGLVGDNAKPDNNGKSESVKADENLTVENDDDDDEDIFSKVKPEDLKTSDFTG